MKEYIISEEKLLSLLEAERELTCLHEMGVDNWNGYDQIFDEDYNDNIPDEWTKEELSDYFKEYKG